ncbi:DNA repair protein RecN [Salaquimonas pukyongi]|uniref:DNA repair protein RecN n=1 Tax=Salaquimonas pukyongi TaxID=2712698 RepID=UPI00096BC199|nr:DNA repair protein RecN [Salaquimonas pukyongi]
MLVQLTIRDIVLIERLDLAFNDGLSVLTGETGAGKSILLDAMSLSLGARGDGGLVRNGCDQGQVAATFDLAASHPVQAVLEKHGIAPEAFLILKRIQSADGRSKAFVNDQPVSVSLMREIGRRLVELHGQHDERALLQTSVHRDLLDAFGGHQGLVERVGAAWRDWQEKRKEVAAFAETVENARRESDYLHNAVDELTALAPQPGEEGELAARRQAMMKAEAVAADLNEAAETLSGDASPIPVLMALAKRLERKAREVPDTLETAVTQLDQGLDAIYRAQQTIEAALSAADFDPRELEQAEERLFSLRAASRKYGVAVENLPELAVKLADDLEALVSGEDRLQALKRELEALEKDYHGLADRLSGERSSAASALAEMVMRELPPLKLEAARFMVRQEADKANAGAAGIDSIEFWVQTNPGTKPGPMIKVASGGELSRFLLALKVALADKGSAPTLVFDEIDTGIGGAVADAIGRRLRRLAEKVQVLSVTHAPQVAARATSHFVITKQQLEATGQERTETQVAAISQSDRREEIARMLAGAQITDEARAAAQQLMDHSAA